MKLTQNYRMISALALAIAGCSSAQESEYFPKPSKNSREYSFEMTSGLLGSQKGKLTERIEDEIEIGGKKYFKHISVISGIPGIPPTVQYRRHSKDGIYVVEGDVSKAPEYREVPFPIAVGQEWSYTTAEGAHHCKAEAIEDLYLFDRTIKGCLKISKTHSMDGVKITTETYFARKFGDVKSIAHGPGIVIEAVLISPSPK